MRGLRRGAAAGRDDQLLAMRRDARDHEPGRGQRAVQALAPALRAAAAQPPPEVVKRRLDALDADLPRRREWVAAMEAEADAQRGRSVDETDWDEVLRRWKPVLAVLAIAFVLWIALALWLRGDGADGAARSRASAR